MQDFRPKSTVKLLPRVVLPVRFDLRIPCLVIISPNAAFARIKDGNGMYFEQAVVIFLIGAILGAVITSSHIFIGQLELSSQASLWWQMISILTSGVTLPVIIHIAGKIFGGNRCWKLTFDAIFHIHVLYILLAAVLFGLVGTFWSYYSIPFDLSAPSIAPDFFSSISFLYNVVPISFGVWFLFVTTKAVKTINAFGTAKAFGIALVAIIASLVFSNIVAGETIIPAG